LGKHVPEDAVLRRHHFAHVRYLLETAAPAPTDSVLRRHHEQWITFECEACSRDEARFERLLAGHDALRAARAAAVELPPAPAPVTAERATPAPEVEAPATAAAAVAPLVESTASTEAAVTEAAPLVAAPEPLAVAAAEPVAPAPAPARIPEDSVLRRHFLAHVQTLLESDGPPRPTDSILNRHYEHWLCTQLAECLQDEARLGQVLTR
jgi:hypothetical protein